MSDGSGTPARPRFNAELNNFTITIPRIATASTLATRATALLIPEAAPARFDATELMTTVVSGATLIAIPNPRTVNAGKNPDQKPAPTSGTAQRTKPIAAINGPTISGT